MLTERQIRAPSTWRLYVVTDRHLLGGRSHLEIARQAVTGGADAVQLRDKEASSRELFDAARELRELTARAGVAFIVNDRLDIALASGADGVHLGQDDLPAAEARRILGVGRILGVSATSVEEALRAERDGADYIGVGPVFEARGTKPDAGQPLGLDLLRRVRELCRVPVVAIGGINPGNVAAVIRAGAHCAAVISAVVSADDIAAVARQLVEIIDAEKGS